MTDTHAPAAGQPEAPSVAEARAAAGRSALSVYIQGARAFAFPASVVPVILGAVLAMDPGPVWWALLPAVLAGAMLMHAGTNFVSEVQDFRRGVDRPETRGGSRVIVEGLLSPRAAMVAGLACFAAGLAIGGALAWLRGWPVLWLGLIGLAGGCFYTGGPVGFKYRALGDVLVFVLMGPLMVLGSHYVLAGRFTLRALLASLPVGCLVSAILSGNNLRDRRDDAAAGIRTLENALGPAGAKAIYCTLVLAAHAIVIALVAVGVLSPWALLALLGAWPAVRNIRTVLAATPDGADRLAGIDVRTAQHHLLFGTLLSLGVLLAAVL